MSIHTAKKHVEMCVRAKYIINQKCPNYCVFLAAHSKVHYPKMQEECGGEFWSIKILSFPERKGLKDPDLIVIDGNNVKYLIEVKWGAIKESKTTDINIKELEQNKINKVYDFGGRCQIHGPVTKNGQRNPNKIFEIKKEYIVDNETKIVFISDFQSIKDNLNSKYNALISQLKKQNILILADINQLVDDIPPIQDVIHCQMINKDNN